MIAHARWMAALSAGLASCALGAAGLLTWLATLATLTFLGVGGAALGRAHTRRVRWMVNCAAAALMVGLALTHTPMVVVFAAPGMAFAAVVAPHQRGLATSCLASGACAVLALATRPTPLVGIVVAATWVMLVATLRLAQLSVRPVAASAPRPLMAIRGPLATSLVVGLLAMLLLPVSLGSSGAGGSTLANRLLRGPVRPPTFDSGPMDLNARGELGDAEVARVSADSPTHWRTGVLSGYDGRAWHPVPVQPGGRVSLTEQGVDVRELMGNDAPATGRAHTYAVRPLQSDAAVLAPGHLQAIRPATRVSYRRGHSVQAPGGDEYEVVVTLPDPFQQANSGRPASVDEEYLSLPRSVTKRTRALARRITAGAMDQAQAVELVEEHLRQTYSYRLDAPTAPSGHDAVDFFLFESKAGFCEHFAAAEAVLLRSVGIPARVAVGYSGGRVEDGWRTITAERAHAWTEVAFAGHGWLVSDSTPAAQPSQRGGAAAGIRRAWQQLMDSMPLRWLVAAGVLLVALGGWQLARMRRRHARPGAAAPATARSELHAASGRLLAALQRTGRAGPPGETYAELARRVAPAAPGLLAAERDAYAQQPLSYPEAREAVAQLDAVTARFLAEQAARSRSIPR